MVSQGPPRGVTGGGRPPQGPGERAGWPGRGGPAGEAIWGPGPGASGLVLWFRSSTPFSN